MSNREYLTVRSLMHSQEDPAEGSLISHDESVVYRRLVLPCGKLGMPNHIWAVRAAPEGTVTKSAVPSLADTREISVRSQMTTSDRDVFASGYGDAGNFERLDLSSIVLMCSVQLQILCIDVDPREIDINRFG